MATDYEKLKKEGYTEEEIKLILEDPLSQVSLTDAPMSPGREDKSATISDNQGNSMRTSSVMMGYNKRGLNLPSGVYVSADELSDAMTTFLTEDSENKKIVCRSTGDIVDVTTLTTTVVEALVEGAGLTLTGTSDKITNQTAYTYGIRGDEKATRVFMAGNKGIQLPNGEYVTLDELQKAMSDYVYMTKDDVIVIPPIPPRKPGDDEIDPIPPKKPGDDTVEEPEEPEKEEEEEKEEKHVVTGRRRWEKWQTIAIAVGTAIIVFLASLGLDDVMIEKKVTEINDKATYSVSQMSEEHVYESIDEAVQRAISEFSTGDSVFVEEGTRYDHESDKSTDKHGIIGEGLREEGDYTLEYVSILDKDNNIIKVEFKEGVNIGDVVTEALNDHGLSLDDVQIRIHIGGPVAGWIDMSDIISEESITPQLIESKFVVEETYSDTKDNFDGTIEVSTPDGTVKLDVMNPDGTLVSDGSTVIGSDGKTYTVDNLDVEHTETTTISNEVVGKKLTLSIDHLIDNAAYAAIAETLLVGGVVALGAAINKKKKEEEDKKEQEDKAVAEFESAAYPGKFDETVQRLATMPNKTNENVTVNEETTGGPKL